MARVTTPRAKSLARSQAAKTARAKPAPAASAPRGAAKAGSAKASAPRRAAVKPTPVASKEDLRARIEKLERANSTLRMKNKDLRLAYVEAAEKVDALTMQLETLERRAARGTGAAPARKRGGANADHSEHDVDEVLSRTADPVNA
ncbi:hypothetical protein [Acidisoma sp. 7E03]